MTILESANRLNCIPQLGSAFTRTIGGIIPRLGQLFSNDNQASTESGTIRAQYGAILLGLVMVISAYTGAINLISYDDDLCNGAPAAKVRNLTEAIQRDMLPPARAGAGEIEMRGFTEYSTPGQEVLLILSDDADANLPEIAKEMEDFYAHNGIAVDFGYTEDRIKPRDTLDDIDFQMRDILSIARGDMKGVTPASLMLIDQNNPVIDGFGADAYTVQKSGYSVVNIKKRSALPHESLHLLGLSDVSYLNLYVPTLSPFGLFTEDFDNPDFGNNMKFERFPAFNRDEYGFKVNLRCNREKLYSYTDPTNDIMSRNTGQEGKDLSRFQQQVVLYGISFLDRRMGR